MHIEAFHSDLYKIKFLISKKPHQNVLGEIITQIYISCVFNCLKIHRTLVTVKINETAVWLMPINLINAVFRYWQHLSTLY